MGETITAEDYRAATKPQKYGAVRTEVDGIMFASKAEARRYQELRLLEDQGEIWGLLTQPRFEFVIEGVNIGSYVGDFHYYEKDHITRIVEDVKGVRTPVYRIKKKLMKALYRIDIVEVTP